MNNDAAAQTGVRRILAAFDAATPSTSSLDALAEMATLLQARLELLLVEDSELAQVAGLPPARQINLRTGAVGPLAPSELAAEFRAREARLRRWLADAAAKRQLRWAVRTVRGEAGDALLLASEASDLLVLRRRPGWERYRSSRTEPLSVARRASQSILLLEDRVARPRAIAVLYRPDAQGTAALILAVRLAAAGNRPLDVLVAASEAIETARERIRAVSSAATTHGPRLRLSRLAPGDALADVAGRVPDGLLVIGADDPILRPADAWDRLRSANRSILLVR